MYECAMEGSALQAKRCKENGYNARVYSLRAREFKRLGPLPCSDCKNGAAPSSGSSYSTSTVQVVYILYFRVGLALLMSTHSFSNCNFRHKTNN